MLNFIFNSFLNFEYINNILHYYYLYITVYKLNIYFKFHLYFLYNTLKYYITTNLITNKILNFFLAFYSFIRNTLIWVNRRFIKKNKRFRIYYKYHNIRYLKFFLFIFYFFLFVSIYKKRNLYTKIQIFFIFIFVHVLILISLHFFINYYNQFELGFFICLFFFWITIQIFKR